MTTFRCSGLALAACLVSASARADIIDPEEAACEDRDAGETCTLSGTAGTCQTKKCKRREYTRDESSLVDTECLVCVPASAKADVPAKTAAPASKWGCAVEPGPLSLGTIPLGIVLVALARRRRR